MLENRFVGLDKETMTGSARGKAMLDDAVKGAPSGASRALGKSRTHQLPAVVQARVRLAEDKWCTTSIKNEWSTSTIAASCPRSRLCGTRS
ncbi:hypothetical protein VNO78_16719 [Psophocarpus tetragonolobus]|uniref:Uncharacterized protein n=1 Tax=Psophocarpus tetragonolobus TaxID=3891 RepID=A0AAN9XKA8_PSOTE